MLKKSKATKTLAHLELTKKTLIEWDRRGMKLNGVIDVELKFCIHVISHKIYISSIPKSVPCEVVDLAFKVVKNNLQFDIA